MEDDDDIPEYQGTPKAEEALPEPEAAEDVPVPEGAEGEDHPDAKPSGVDKRISKLVYEREEAKRTAAYWQGKAEAGGQRDGSPALPSQADDGTPLQENYDTYEAFLRAVARHEIAAEMTVERERLTTETQARQVMAEFETRAGEFRSKNPDFEAVVKNPELSISPHMRDAIHNSPDGAEIAYHLGHHPEEALRISQLHPYHQMMEMGRIAAAIAAPSVPPAPSGAPAPISRIRGVAEPAKKDPEKMTDAEWFASVSKPRKRG